VYKVFTNADFSLVDDLHFNCFCKVDNDCRSTAEDPERKPERVKIQTLYKCDAQFQNDAASLLCL